jgi:glycosyltransferase involved in cell wall biosynthesis
MKRILYLSRGGAVGGSQRQLHYVVTNLDHSYEPIVACRTNGQFFGQLRGCGIKTSVFTLRPWRTFSTVLYRYIDAERLARYANEQRVSLVHSSDLWLSGYMAWVARKLKIPSVLHVRTPIRPDEVYKHHCYKATAIIAISHRTKQNLISAGINPEKITQIDDAVNLKIFRSMGFKENVLRRDFSVDGRTLVGIVGRIDPSKHQLAFLQAAEQVVRGLQRNVTFFIIGETHSRKYFEKLKHFIRDKGLQQHVILTGRREDMPQVLSSLDILVSLSGGSVMFEAMACGKTVISAGFSRREDSVHIQNGRTGVLVTSTGFDQSLRDKLTTGRNSELVQALSRLIDSPNIRRQIGRKARKWAESNFCHIAMAAKTKQLYQRLLQD